MTQPADQTLPALSDWQVQLLRLTAFPSPDADASTPKAGAWEQVVGEAPEHQNSKPREQRLKEEGAWEGGRLQFDQKPQRCDWFYVVSLEKQEEKEDISLGGMEETCNHFARLMDKWFEMSPSLERMAFGAMLQLPVSSAGDAYHVMARVTPVPAEQIDPSTSSDFLYQINRQRQSKVIAELTLNRLSKWSTARILSAKVKFAEKMKLHEPEQESLFCQLETDVNTTPEFDGILPIEKLPEVLRELIELTREIAEKGDIP